MARSLENVAACASLSCSVSSPVRRHRRRAHHQRDESQPRGAREVHAVPAGDLYFRLNGITIHVPPLRTRKVEIGPLARAFAAQTAWAMGEKPPQLAADVIGHLEERDWPGNVRELRNVIERGVVLAAGATVERAHLLLEDAPAPVAGASATLPGELADLEKQRIVEALARAGGNQTKAAELLGMPRRTLVTRLSEYGIEHPPKR